MPKPALRAADTLIFDIFVSWLSACSEPKKEKEISDH